MLVKYVRDCFGNPVGCVVAIGPGQVGYSMCSPKDHFRKDKARLIAIGRARFDECSTEEGINKRVTNRPLMLNIDLDYDTERNVVKREVAEMRERSFKYYQPSVD